MTGYQNIIDALAELGDTSNAVAHTLIELECRGEREEGSACPVFHYLTRAKGIERIERVVRDEVWLGDGPFTLDDLPEERVPLPLPVQEFVDEFDAGAWFELEERAR
jgi:hypothetical protein